MGSLFFNKKQLFLTYAFFALLALAAFLLSNFALSAFTLSLIFFAMIFVPGYCLARIFKIEFKDWLGRLVLYLALGLIFIFLTNFTAMFFGLTINILLQVFVFLIIILFVLALLLDILRPHKDVQQALEINKIFSINNLPILLLVAVSLFALYFIGLQGSLFQGGDPSFHIAILRKAFEGQPLTAQNLGYIKSSSVHVAYGFPVWHIFLSLLAKISRSDIFDVWKQISLPLSALVLLVWYWFLRNIFPSKGLAVLGVLLLITFYFTGVGYLFTCLPIPDTLTRLLLMPLSFALALKYIFDKNTDYKLLVVFSLLLVLMAAIHLSQYFYFLLAMIIFGVFYAIFKFKEPDFKETIKRIVFAAFANFTFFIFLAIFFEINGRVFSSTIKSFMSAESTQVLKYGKFQKFGVLFQYSYMMLPLLIFFLKKYHKLFFLLAVMLIMPFAYIGVVKVFLMKFLGYIFLNRMLAVLTWHFVIWALVLGFILIIVDRFIGQVSRVSRYLKYFLELLVGLFATWLTWAQFDNGLALKIYNVIFSAKIHLWFNQNYLWLAGVLIFSAVVSLILQKKLPKFENFFSLDEAKNPLSHFFLMFCIVFILFVPNFNKISSIWENTSKHRNFIFQKSDTTAIAKDMYLSVGDEQTINFISVNISPKSIFLTNKSGVYLAMLADQQMAAYPHSVNETTYSKIFKNNLSSAEKFKYLKSGKIEYVLLVEPVDKSFFESNPSYFTKIYQGKAMIYRVNVN